MKRQVVNYETLLKITRAMSMSRDPEKVVQFTVDSVREAMDIKGCILFLMDAKSSELAVAAASGMSDEYLNKGPVSSLESMARSLTEGPVAIYDVLDDPRIQYPEEARAEGIASILSVPIHIRGEVVGCLRVYTAEPWEFTLNDVNFVQAIAQIAGILVDMSRLYKGQQEYIDVLATMRESREM